MIWEKLTANEFDKAIEDSKGLCAMPLGCLERHGEHIGVGCDSLIAKTIAEEAAEIEPCVVFPTGMWLGDLMPYHSNDAEKDHKRGCIALKPTTLISIMTELCEEIHRNGFNKILILNSHGGNCSFLDFFVRSMMYEKRDFAVMWTSANKDNELDPAAMLKVIKSRPDDFKMLTDEDYKTLEHFAEIGCGGGHSDFRETMLCMSKMPELIRPDKYDSCRHSSVHKADYLGEMAVHHGAAWGVNFPDAYSGNPPYGCTQTIGQAALKIASENLAKIFKMLKDDENCVKMSQRIDF